MHLFFSLPLSLLPSFPTSRSLVPSLSISFPPLCLYLLPFLSVSPSLPLRPLTLAPPRRLSSPLMPPPSVYLWCSLSPFLSLSSFLPPPSRVPLSLLHAKIGWQVVPPECRQPGCIPASPTRHVAALGLEVCIGSSTQGCTLPQKNYQAQQRLP